MFVKIHKKTSHGNFLASEHVSFKSLNLIPYVFQLIHEHYE